MTEENSEGAFDKVKKGFKKVVVGSGNVVEGTAQGVKEVGEEIKEGAEETGREIKEGAEETGEDIEEATEEVTDSDSYVDIDKEVVETEGEGKEPMNPDDIAEHEPTAVKRDQNQGTSGDAV